MDDVPPVSENAKRVAALRNAVYEAYDALQKAHVAYEQALAIAAETEMGSDGWLALQRQGREYCDAVRLYSTAIDSWLSSMEPARADAVRLLARTETKKEVRDPPIVALRRNQQFLLHSSVIAMRLLNRQELVALSKQTRGTILQQFGASAKHGLVLIEVAEEQFLVRTRDLEECAELLQ